MSGCLLSYLPVVDAICVSLDAVPDTLIHAGGADPAAIANVIAEQLRSRGYIQDDGTDPAKVMQNTRDLLLKSGIARQETGADGPISTIDLDRLLGAPGKGK